jgi:hypothetical protein
MNALQLLKLSLDTWMLPVAGLIEAGELFNQSVLFTKFRELYGQYIYRSVVGSNDGD